MYNLMVHSVDVWRPVETQQTAQTISGYTRVYTDVPCFIQPVDSKMEMDYDQRTNTMAASIYTTATNLVFHREDIFETPDGSQFHLVSEPKPALWTSIYFELSAELYAENAKKRLNREAYD